MQASRRITNSIVLFLVSNLSSGRIRMEKCRKRRNFIQSYKQVLQIHRQSHLPTYPYDEQIRVQYTSHITRTSLRCLILFVRVRRIREGVCNEKTDSRKETKREEKNTTKINGQHDRNGHIS